MRYSFMWVLGIICAMTVLFSSCNKKEDIQEPDVPGTETSVNTFTYNGKTYDIKSAVRNETASVVEFYLSTKPNLSAINDIVSGGDYVILKADSKKEGSTDSFTKSGSLIAYNDLKFEYGDKGMAYIKFSYESDNEEVSIEFKAETLYDGTEAAEGISGTYTGAFSDHAKLASLELSADSDVLLSDKPIKITASCTPEDYYPGNLEWSIDNSTGNSVELAQDPDDEYSYILSCSGNIKEGEISVIVKDKYSEVSKSLLVDISLYNPDEPEVDYNIIVLNTVSLNKKLGDEPVKLIATCYKDNTDTPVGTSETIRLRWLSDDESVATVDSDGTVNFVGTGKATDEDGNEIVANSGSAVITVYKPSNTSVNTTCKVSVSKSDVYVERIILYPGYKSLKPGDKFDITYEVVPENAVDKDIAFTSEDPDIATVGLVDGKYVVTAVSLGKTRIKASSNNVTVYCNVEVTEDGTPSEKIPVESITLRTDGNVTNLPQLNELQITPYYSPNGAWPSDTEWSSTDPSIATVDENGLVKAVLEDFLGPDDKKQVTIIHRADGKSASIPLTIVQAVPKSIVITDYPEGQKIYLGESFTFTAKVLPEQAPQSILWECYQGSTMLPPSNIFNPRTGLFQAISLGTYTVCAKSSDYNNVEATMNIEVVKRELISATLSETSMEMQVGDVGNLSVTFNPSNATDKNVAWSSSNSGVATVSGGKVTAVAEGTATITARINDSFDLTCSVIVRSASTGPKVGDYFFSDGTYDSSIKIGKTVVGVVFYVKNPTLQDSALKRDYPDCTHGLVLGLKDEEAGQWSSNINVKISPWATENGYSTLCAFGYLNGRPVLNEDGKILRGYNNTQAIILSDQFSESDMKVTDNLPGGAAASKASSWYVPSIGDLLEVSNNYALINANIVKAGGETMDGKEYWSSSEGTSSIYSYAGKITVSTGNCQTENKTTVENIRHIFAF